MSRYERKHNVWLKVGTWLIAEIILNLVGLDNLADYSEFLYEQDIFVSMQEPQVQVIAPPI